MIITDDYYCDLLLRCIVVIYHSDLSYKQYEEIIEFMREQILEYKKNYAQN